MKLTRRTIGVTVGVALVFCIAAFVVSGLHVESPPRIDATIDGPPSAETPEQPPVVMQRLAVDDRVDATVSTGTLIVSVRYQDGMTGKGVVVLVHEPQGDPRVGVWRETADDGGTCTFATLTPGRWLAHVAAAPATRQAVATVSAGATARLELVIPVSIEIRGRVLDPHRLAVRGADIVLAPPSTRDHDAAVVAVSGHDGTFFVRSGHSPSLVGARASGYGPSRMVMIEGENRSPREGVELILVPFGGDVKGRVTTSSGAAVARATVRIGAGRLDAIRTGTGPIEPLPGQTWTDVDGRFALAGMPEGKQHVAVRAPGWAAWEGRCLVVRGQTVECNVVLSAGGNVTGTVTTKAGSGISGVVVTLGKPGTLAFMKCIANEAGEFRMTDVAPGAVLLSAQHPRYGKATAEALVRQDETVHCAIVLDPGRVLAGRVESTEGRVIQRVSVSVQKVGGGWGWVTSQLDDRGRFWVTNLPDTPVHVSIEGQGIVRKEFRRIVVRDDEIVFVVQEKPPASATVTGIVVGVGGEPIGGAQVNFCVEELLGHPTRVDFTWTDGKTGAFRVGPVSPDLYAIRVDAPGYARHVVRDIRVPSYAEHDAGVIPLVRGGDIRIRQFGVRPGDPEMEVFNSRDEWMGDIPSDLSMALEPGRYQVRLRGLGVIEDAYDVVVAEGKTSDVDVAWRTGTRCRLVMQHAPRETAAWVEIVFASDQGKAALRRRVVLRVGETELVDERCLPSGLCHVAVRLGERTWTQEVQVVDQVGEPQEIRMACDG